MTGKKERKKERKNRLVVVVCGIKHHCPHLETLPHLVAAAAKAGVLERGMQTDCNVYRCSGNPVSQKEFGQVGGEWLLLVERGRGLVLFPLTSRTDPLVRVVDLQHRHLVRLLV